MIVARLGEATSTFTVAGRTSPAWLADAAASCRASALIAAAARILGSTGTFSGAIVESIAAIAGARS